ncbi:MAG: flavin reductase family protein [Thermotogae bacterium]|nr:flavin reductase family protein [Thermotogota bacterium]
MRELYPFNFRRLYASYPRSAVVATSYDGEHKSALSLVWHTPLSFDPPVYSISVSPKRFSHDVILKALTFAVHFFPYERAELVERIGSVSGREVDKFSRLPLPHFMSPLKNPILEGAYLVLDCEYLDHRLVGDHTLIWGEVKRIYYDPDLVEVAEDGGTDLKVLKPTLYLGRGRYITVDVGSLKRLR